jgi:hypothetical protein
LLRLGRV